MGFDIAAASKAWLATRAKRWLAEKFASITNEDLLLLVEHDKDLMALVAQHRPEEIKLLRPFAPIFEEADVLSWLPERTLVALKSHPKGMEWASKQCALLKDVICSKAIVGKDGQVWKVGSESEVKK